MNLLTETHLLDTNPLTVIEELKPKMLEHTLKYKRSVYIAAL